MIANVVVGQLPIEEDDIQAYIDGSLDAKRRSEVEAYLAGRPDEVERVQAYRLQNIGLHALFDRPIADPTEGSIERLRRNLHAVVTRQRLFRRMAASLALVLGVGVVGWWGFGSYPVPGDAESVVAQQRTEADEPYSRDPPRAAEPLSGVTPASLGGWLSQRLLGGQADWPDLRPFGLALVGERMAATASGFAVVLVYQDDVGHRLALHINLNGDDLPIVAPPVGEKDAALYWRSGPLLLGVIGARERGELLRIAEAVGDQIGSFGVDPSAPGGDQLLSVQSDTPPPRGPITQAAGTEPEADAPKVAHDAGGEAAVPAPAAEPGSVEAPDRPPTENQVPAGGGEQGEQPTSELEQLRPFSELPPPRVWLASHDRLPAPSDTSV